ncbi:MAG: FAD-dependent oxidoreductase [Gemmatimonadetes bacterium]|nr:FAD-dependent oxidoreductase [Gemmatimonadota bacterium]
MSDRRNVDVLIAGQGAAAFSAGLYSARYQMNALIVGETFGGETALGGLIENYPGAPDIDGFELMLKMQEQVQKYGVPIVSAKVEHVRRVDGCFEAGFSDGTGAHTASVILAVGRERRKLGLPHEEEWIGKGVSYCSTCDAPLYRGKVAAIVGGGNAAVEGAILTAKYAASVYLIYRRAQFTRPDPVLLRQLEKTENVSVLFETVVTELIGSDQKGLEAIRLSRPFEGSDVLEVHGILIEAGADPRLELPNQLGLNINPETNEVHVDRMMRTGVDGVYAAGDLTDGSGPLKQTVTAAAQGAIAALSAYHHVSSRATPCPHNA